MNEQNLAVIQSGEEAARKGHNGGIASGKARRERAQRIKDLFAAFGVEPIDPELARDADGVLLAMTNSELETLSNNEEMPAYMRQRARLLLQPDDEKAFDVSEKMLDRAVGKPKQQIDGNLQGAVPVIIGRDGLD